MKFLENGTRPQPPTSLMVLDPSPPPLLKRECVILSGSNLYIYIEVFLSQVAAHAYLLSTLDMQRCMHTYLHKCMHTWINALLEREVHTQEHPIYIEVFLSEVAATSANTLLHRCLCLCLRLCLCLCLCLSWSSSVSVPVSVSMTVRRHMFCIRIWCVYSSVCASI